VNNFPVNHLRNDRRGIGRFVAVSLVLLLAAFGFAEENAGLPASDTTAIRAQVFQSEALGREVSYSTFVPVGVPPEGGWPLVMLLHGAGRNHRTIADDAVCRAVVLRQKFVIVFADGKLGWYLDSPVDPKSRYQSMLRELIAHARRTLPISPKPERTGICGWSMGGYGAMRFAETFPGEIGAVATSIALLDFPNPQLPKAENYAVSPLFGTDESAWLKSNCMTDVAPLRGKPILFVTGKDAFDAQMNRNFHAKLEAAGIAHTFREVDGAHVFRTVQETLPVLLDFFGEKLASPASR
jgi:S-formylglutathione hydrolase FrmB